MHKITLIQVLFSLRGSIVFNIDIELQDTNKFSAVAPFNINVMSEHPWPWTEWHN